MIRIAIEANSALNNRPTGVGRYTAAIVGEMARLCADEANDTELLLLYKLSRRKQRHHLPVGPNIRHCPMTESALQHFFARRYRANGLLCPYKLHPLVPGAALVPVIHDLHAVHGVNYTADTEKSRQRHIATLRFFAENAARLIFISRYVREDFRRHFSVELARTEVIYHGVGPEFHPRPPARNAEFCQQFGIGRPYLLFAGDPRPSKNLARVLDAYAASRTRATHDIVILGLTQGTAQGERLKEQIRSLGIAQQVHLLHYLPSRQLPLAFAAASGLLFVSLDEGFGLPILEAMASGVPVLTSNVTACPEVAAGHAIIVDPYDVDAIRDGLERLPAMDPALRRDALRYAGRFTWNETARQTLSVLKSAATG